MWPNPSLFWFLLLALPLHKGKKLLLSCYCGGIAHTVPKQRCMAVVGSWPCSACCERRGTNSFQSKPGPCSLPGGGSLCTGPLRSHVGLCPACLQPTPSLAFCCRTAVSCFLPLLSCGTGLAVTAAGTQDISELFLRCCIMTQFSSREWCSELLQLPYSAQRAPI